ncbi:MAG: glycerate kinase [Terriglobales bacterium]
MCAPQMLGAEYRDVLRRILHRALEDCSIAKAFARQVQYDRGVLRIAEDLYGLPGYDKVLAVSIGKAAYTMAQALAQQVGRTVQGVAAGPTDPERMLPRFEYFRGGHPLPDAGSMRAAEGILRALRSVSEQSLVIFLLSGGGSAVVEKPLFGISLDDLIATHRALVHSGAPIAEINAIRKHLSAVKGGRLAQAAGGARQVSAMVVDVPEKTLDALASGPTMPDRTTVEDCYRVVAKYELLPQFPPAVRDLFIRRALEETPKSDDPAFTNSRWWVLLSNANALRAAGQRAAMERFAVEVDNSCDDWDYAAAADYLLNKLRKLRQGVSRACLLSGGEVTVKVTNGGVGGRNQQFALYCATKIAGENIAVLSAGTDGIDGNSPAAGAVVDGTTMTRARERGLDPATALAKFDAFPLFDALGDAIITGPTGNNVRDLRVLLAW